MQRIHDLEPDPRAEAVYSSEAYKKDPSRYLPGLVTPYAGLLPLTANNQLDVSNGCSRRFFPREALAPRAFDDKIVDEIAEIMLSQARIIGSLDRPLTLAATGWARQPGVGGDVFRSAQTVLLLLSHAQHQPSDRRCGYCPETGQD